jgi:hypothetical protein
VEKNAACRRNQGEGQSDGGPQNDNAPFDPKQWRKTYMREYMRRLRERKRQEKLKQSKD